MGLKPGKWIEIRTEMPLCSWSHLEQCTGTGIQGPKENQPLTVGNAVGGWWGRRGD